MKFGLPVRACEYSGGVEALGQDGVAESGVYQPYHLYFITVLKASLM